jgi:hypothetical protein
MLAGKREELRGGERHTLRNPMSLAYSWKHWRQHMSPYLRIRPCLLAHTRLHSADGCMEWIVGECGCGCEGGESRECGGGKGVVASHPLSSA